MPTDDAVAPDNLVLTRREILTGGIASALALTTTAPSFASSEGSKRKATCDDSVVRIAVVQQDGNPGGVEANRQKALAFASQALAAEADVILFHEELLAGYVENLRSLAEPADGITTQTFQRLLQSSGTDARVIYGLTEKSGDKYYISAVVVSKDGIVAHYRKTHLFPIREAPASLRNEPAVYTAGDRLVTFKIREHLCGLMICFDGDFPEMTRSYANVGCRMLFWMNNRMSRGYEEVKTLAFSNSIIMATSCCTGKDETNQFCSGGSNITGAQGELQAEIWGKEGVITADVRPREVDLVRKSNVFFTEQRPSLYRYP
jgi:predicted amidohydrolase